MKKLNLYWASTPCNIENWFVIAPSTQEAKNLHADGEGFDRSYTRAKLVCEIPDEIVTLHKECKESYWPSLDLLKDLGFKIVQSEFPRIVSLRSNVYNEGSGMIKILEYCTSQFPGLYVINIVGSETYKIGFTKNLTARLQTFRTGLPFPIRLKFYVMTQHYEQLEKDIHKLLVLNLIRGEWFSLKKSNLKNLKDYFITLDKKKYHLVNYSKAHFEV